MERGEAFSGGAVNAVDAKGRVSLPSAFRATIDRRLARSGIAPSDEQRQVTLREHRSLPCLMAYDRLYEERLLGDLDDQVAELRGIERADTLERLQLEYLGPTRPIGYDGAGRMNLPQSLREQAGIGDLAYFVSAGQSFQLWAPERFRAAFKDKPILVRALDGFLAERGARP